MARKTKKSPRRFVLFFGAGAAVPFGYPTTEGILPAVRAAIAPGLKPSQRPKWLRDAEKYNPDLSTDLRTGLKHVFPGLRRLGKQDTVSIIDVLSLLDHLIASKQSLSPRFAGDRLLTMRRYLALCMNGVLRGTQKPQIRKNVVNWVLRQVAAGNRVSLVTTNYDTSYDWPLFKAIAPENRQRVLFERVDFGTSVLNPRSVEFNRPARSSVAVLKLHGSLNSLRCEQCGHLYVNPTDRIETLEYWEEVNEFNQCKCLGRLRSILVAPSLVRDVREPHLLSIWNAALNELRLAHEWYFAGYSLPQEDIAIRSLLLRAYHGRRLKKLRVRLALYDPAEIRRRAANPAPPPSGADQLLKEELARKTLQRYRDFLPDKHFVPDEWSYFPTGIEDFAKALAAETAQ